MPENNAVVGVYNSHTEADSTVLQSNLTGNPRSKKVGKIGQRFTRFFVG